MPLPPIDGPKHLTEEKQLGRMFALVVIILAFSCCYENWIYIIVWIKLVTGREESTKQRKPDAKAAAEKQALAKKEQEDQQKKELKLKQEAELKEKQRLEAEEKARLQRETEEKAAKEQQLGKQAFIDSLATVMQDLNAAGEQAIAAQQRAATAVREHAAKLKHAMDSTGQVKSLFCLCLVKHYESDASQCCDFVKQFLFRCRL